jgi:hypothetical protein
MAIDPDELRKVPTLPDAMVDRMKRGYPLTDEQEIEAEKAIKQAGLEIRRRSGASLEDLRAKGDL